MLASQECESRDKAAKAEIAILAIISVLSLIFFPFIYIIYINVYSKRENKCVHTLLILIQTTGAALFIYGDNINHIMGRYSKCGNKCLEGINVSARLALGLSLTIFHALPHSLRKLFKCKDFSIEEEETVWLHALNMTTTIIKIDSLYTTVTTVVLIDKFCNNTQEIVSWIFLLILFLFGIFMKVIDSVHSKMNIEKKNTHKYIKITSGISIICLLLYLLADNPQPIDCAFGCNYNTITNSSFECDAFTEMKGNCNIAGSALRLVFMMLVLGGFIFVSLLLLYQSHRDKKNRVTPISR